MNFRTNPCNFLNVDHKTNSPMLVLKIKFIYWVKKKGTKLGSHQLSAVKLLFYEPVVSTGKEKKKTNKQTNKTLSNKFLKLY